MANLERSVSVTMKVTAEDAKAFKQAAEDEGMSVSEYVRAATFMYMALSGNKYALKLLGRGALRTSAEIGSLLLGWCRQKGWLTETTNASR